MEKLQNLVKHSGLVVMCLIALSSGLSLGYSMCMNDMFMGIAVSALIGLVISALIFFDSYPHNTTFASVTASFLFSIFLGIGTFFFSVEPPTIVDPNPDMQLELQQCKASIQNAKKALAQ